MKSRKPSKQATETRIGISKPTIRGPRISLFPFKITGFRFVPPRARVKGRGGDAATRMGLSVINRFISKITRSIFKR